MTRPALIALSLLSLGVTVGGTARHAPSLDGDWAGVITIGGHASPIRAHLKSQASSETSGSVDLFGDATGADLRAVRVSGDSFTAVIPLRLTGPTTIRARIVADTLIGEVTRGNQTGSIRLLHLAPLDTAAAHHDEGLYVAGGDTLIVDRVTPDLLAITEPTAHAIRILYPVGANDYIAGPTLFAALPARWRIRIRGEATDAATLTLSRDGRTTTARRVPLHIEEVAFKHDTVSLAGAFIRPIAAGRYPVVIHMHGSGASIRTSHLGIAYYLAVHGIASLMYDKRGTPASTGTLASARYADLAADAVAGAEYLMHRDDVDTNHIGFTGISEGAGTSERAAALFRKTAFEIPLSGGPLSANVWEYYETANQLVTDGRFNAKDTAAAMSFLRARDYYAQTRRGWATYESLVKIAVAPESKWFGYATTDLFGWAKPDSPGWNQKALTYFDDPLPTLRTIHCPVLSINGEYDTPPALAISVPLMKRAFAEGGNRDVTIRILPHANHNLFLTKSSNEHEMDNVAEFSPELFPLITSWIEAKVHP
jgi:dienelactone hydrolase